jgi:hypothetical protein
MTIGTDPTVAARVPSATRRAVLVVVVSSVAATVAIAGAALAHRKTTDATAAVGARATHVRAASDWRLYRAGERAEPVTRSAAADWSAYRAGER